MSAVHSSLFITFCALLPGYSSCSGVASASDCCDGQVKFASTFFTELDTRLVCVFAIVADNYTLLTLVAAIIRHVQAAKIYSANRGTPLEVILAQRQRVALLVCLLLVRFIHFVLNLQREVAAPRLTWPDFFEVRDGPLLSRKDTIF